MGGGEGSRSGNLAAFRLILAILLILLLPGGAPALVITNTASVSSNLGVVTSSAFVTTPIRTLSTVEFLQYAPGAPAVNVPDTRFSSDGTVSGIFTTTTPITEWNLTPIAIPGSVDLQTATTYHGGEPIFIRLTDLDQNINPALAETVLVTVTTSVGGDSILLRLTETGPSTGIFAGVVQSTANPAVVNDRLLSVAIDDRLRVDYFDAFDIANDTSFSMVQVDPFGVVFSTATGAPLNGAIVTLWDFLANGPATVFADDGITPYPATVTSGDAALGFPAGGFRFPLVSPGTYRLDVVPPPGYAAPSTVATAAIQALPGAPFAIVTGSRGETFPINPGPALKIDIPLDSQVGGLYISKKAQKETAGLGEFLQYSVSVSNGSPGALAGVTVTDLLPPGFRYQPGSARMNQAAIPDPAVGPEGRTLTFALGGLAAGSSAELRYVAGITPAARPGLATNSARAAAAGNFLSNLATATVRVVNDLMDDRSHLVGRVLFGTCDALPVGRGAAGLRLTSRNLGELIEYRAEIGIDQVPVNDLALLVELPEVIEFVTGSARVNGKVQPDPVRDQEQLRFELGDVPADSDLALVFQTRPRLFTFGEFSPRAQIEFFDPDSTALGARLPLRTPMVTNRFRNFSRTVRPRFDTLKAELKADDLRELDSFISELKDLPVHRLHIVGHADERVIRGRSRSIFADNEVLSKARARVVAEYLAEKLGLTPEQLAIEGEGTSQQLRYTELLTGTSPSRDEQLSYNRRVEVFVELAGQEGNTGFVVTKEDSGEKRIKTNGVSPGASPAEVGLGIPGVKGVRLFMEDGRYVDTDEKGLYHFEGLTPGTHVVQVDVDSLPENLEIYQCEENTRFAGVPHSRFVDLERGALWRADFFVRRHDPGTSQGKLTLRMTSGLENGGVRHHINIGGERLALDRRTLTVELPDGFIYHPGSSEMNGRALADPVAGENSLIFDLGSGNGESWQETLSFVTDLGGSYEGDHGSTAYLSGETAAGRILTSRPVGTVLSTQVDSASRVVFGASFGGDTTGLQEADLQRLAGVIDYLRGRNIRSVRVLYRPLTNEAGADPDLAREQLELVRERLLTGLGLSRQQIVTAWPEAVRPGSGRGRIEVLVNLPDDRKAMTIQVTAGDSGLVSQEIRVLNPAPDIMLSAPEPMPAARSEGIINLNDGQRIPTRSQPVRFELDSRLKPELKVDGVPVPVEKQGFSQKLDNGRTLYTYIGVDLGAPGEHSLALAGIDPFGNARFQQEVKLVVTREIADLRIVETGGNIADGKTPVRVRVALLDSAGDLVNAPVELELRAGDLSPDHGRAALPRLRELRETVRTVAVDRDGWVIFAPVSTSGSHHATLAYGELTADAQVYVGPAYREWIMVGLAEGTAAHNTLSGNMQNLSEAELEEGYYDEGRLAFYAKGKVLGRHLLTAAYDSRREDKPVDNGLLGAVDPNKYYTLYGDKTEVRYDAASAEKLYLKLESDKYYLLFGDYNTGLTVTELSRYSRNLTGLKGEYDSERIRATAFGAEADQAFARDELRGDGTSGLYHLSRNGIVPGSDRITVETRDRFHSEIVLETRLLTPFIDYTLDPVSGTVYFREPVYSRDAAFNPVYIVAEYETESGNSGDLIGGGRASYKLGAKGPEVGASLVHEGISGSEATLVGTDLQWQLGRNTTLKAEVATTSRKSFGTDVEGEAMLAEIRHQDKKVEGRAYFREQDGEFGLGQQKGSETGTRKFGLDTRYHLTPALAAGGELFRQENLGTNGLRDVLAGVMEYQHKPWTSTLGASFARDEDQTGTSRESTLLTGGVKRSFLAERLDLYTRGEAAVGNDANPDYPSRLILGAEYKLTSAAALFAAHEMTWGENQDSQATRVGVKGKPWRDATFTSSVEDQAGEYGPRTFANLGLTQGLPVDEHLRLDFGLERTETLRHPGDISANVNVPPASGSAREDFTAVSTGATYKEKLWSATGRGEYRDGDFEDKAGLLLGFYREQSPGFGLSATLKHFDSQRTNQTTSTSSNLEFSVAWRPIDSRWIVLDRARLADLGEETADSATKTRKYINNLNANFLYDRRNQLSVGHGIKYVIDSFDGDQYSGLTQILGLAYRHDLSAKWDLGLQGAVRASEVGAAQLYSCGVSVGHTFVENTWLSLGYNFNGFRDDDFTAADYTAQGVYLKFRMKFDQRSARKLLAWWEK